jgi:hypothetical protein
MGMLRRRNRYGDEPTGKIAFRDCNPGGRRNAFTNNNPRYESGRTLTYTRMCARALSPALFVSQSIAWWPS